MSQQNNGYRTGSHVLGARVLGLASLGIGVTEIAAPEKVEQLLGIEDNPEHRGVLRILGVREIMHGIGILADRRDARGVATGVWGRVAGDVLDSTLLAAAGMKTRRPESFAMVAAMVTGIGLADLVCAMRVSRQRARCDTTR